MTSLALLAAAAALAAAATEALQSGSKVQSRLGVHLGIFSLAGALSVLVLAHRGPGVPVCVLFWAGAYLTWFGTRSHLESSILLRLLCYLGEESMAGDELMGRYRSRHGIARRREELVRGGFLEVDGDACRPTAKGRLILAVVKWLR